MTNRLLDIAAQSGAAAQAVFDHSEKRGLVYEACLARGRSSALGQSLLIARAHRFSYDDAG